jgi:hypothetical protein
MPNHRLLFRITVDTLTSLGFILQINRHMTKFLRGREIKSLARSEPAPSCDFPHKFRQQSHRQLMLWMARSSWAESLRRFRKRQTALREYTSGNEVHLKRRCPDSVFLAQARIYTTTS